MKRGLQKNVRGDLIDQWYDIARRRGAFFGTICGAGFRLFIVWPERKKDVLKATPLRAIPIQYEPTGVTTLVPVPA